MKKRPLNFLGKKNQSLFDTKVEIRETEHTEFVLDSSTIPESGTAKVRARPTVKHYSSSDALQGYAVPMPKVPLLPPVNGLQTTGGAANREKYSSMGSLAVSDPVEGEIFIPPPPSTAPPPPPQQHVPPRLEFTSGMHQSSGSFMLASLLPPPMPPPKPPSQIPMEDVDLAYLKPPAMRPPMPPSDFPDASFSRPLSSYPSDGLKVANQSKFPFAQSSVFSFEQPQFSQSKNHKIPPPKPTRLSSMPSQDGLPPFVAPPPPPPVDIANPSSFNPQNTAILYSTTKTTFFGGQMDREKSKSMIILQDVPPDNSPFETPLMKDVPPKSIEAPVKPARRHSSGMQLENDVGNLKYSLQSTLPSQGKIQGINASNSKLLGTTEDVKPMTPLITASPQLERTSTTSASTERSHTKQPVGSPGRTKYSAYSHAPQSGKFGETTPSPMALLLAAKERDRQKASLSRENSAKRNSSSEPSTMRIRPSESRPNSFTVIPRCNSSSSWTAQETSEESIFPGVPSSISKGQSAAQPCTASLSPRLPNEKPTNLNPHKSSSFEENVGTSSLFCTNSFRNEENGEDVCVPVIPPPPEFANPSSEEEDSLNPVEDPPKLPLADPPPQNSQLPPIPPAVLAFQGNAPPPAPNLPSKKSSFPPSMLSAAPVVKSKGPIPPPKPKPGKVQGPPDPASPKSHVTSKPLPQVPLKTASLSASQATLLSILQKKMLEMDQKHSHQEYDPSGDDWGSPLSDDEYGVPSTSKQSTATSRQTPLCPNPNQGLDLGELESQVAKRGLSSSTKPADSNGAQSKQHSGLTFTVRPGSKQPITLISKND